MLYKKKRILLQSLRKAGAYGAVTDSFDIELRKYDDICLKLLEIYERQKINNDSLQESNLLSAKSKMNKKGESRSCFFCGKCGHIKSNC